MAEPQQSKDLVEQAQNGDREAFETLFQQHTSELEQYVRTRIGSHISHVLAVDDVVQETSVRALGAVAHFQWRGERSFLRWMRGIAEHVILNEVRQLGRGKVLYVETETADPGPTPSTSLRRDERFERLRAAVADLPEDYRNVILWRVEGLRVREIADRLGRTPKAVSLVVARALAKLKDRMGDTESLGLPRQTLRREESDGV